MPSLNKTLNYTKYLLIIAFIGLGLYLVVTNKPSSAKIFIPKSEVLSQSLEIIGNNYFNPDKIDPQQMFERALQDISLVVPSFFVEYNQENPDKDLIIKVGDNSYAISNTKLKNLTDLDARLQIVLQHVKQNLSMEDFPNLNEIDYTAINAILDTLDPHSSLLTPKTYQDFTDSAQGEYAGVGMVIRQQDDKILVASIIGKDSPAKKSGVLANDLIIKIDQYSTAGMTIEDAKNKLRGPKDSKVEILVERESQDEPLKITLIRDDIRLSSVSSYSIEQDQKTFGYIRINSVISNTANELRNELIGLGTNLDSFGGLILDLRNNPGGLLNQAIAVSNLFLKEGVIVSIASFGNKNIVNYKAKPYGTVDDFPIVVIINRFSASAAEIIAGALKQNKRALVIGETSFGKGTVQSLVEKFEDGSGLKLTTSQYLTPGEISIQSVGIIPDLYLHRQKIMADDLLILPVSSRSEKELENSFTNDKTETNNSKFDIYYLEKLPVIKSEEDAIIAAYGEVDPKTIEQDYNIKIALEILDKTADNNYNSLLESAENLVKDETEQQSAAILDEFKNIGINWQKTDQANNDAAKISFDLQVQIQDATDSFKPLNQPFPAQSKGRLVLTAKNLTDRPIQQLNGKIKADHIIFNEKQFAFGWVEPQQSKTWFLPFNTDKFNNGDSIELLFEFQEGWQDPFQQQTEIFSFAASNNPKLEYTFTVNPTSSTNNNQLAQYLGQLQLFNKSNIDSGKLSISLKNADFEFLQLDHGLLVLNNLEAQNSIDETFNFIATAKPDDSKFDLLLNIFSHDYPNSSIEQKISFNFVNGELEIDNSIPEILFNNNNFSSEEKFNIRAIVSDDSGLKDIYIFQDQQKIYYKEFKDLDKSHEINLDVTLAEKESDFLIIARDNFDVKAQKRKHILLTTE